MICISQRKLKLGVDQYVNIKWKDFPTSENSWELLDGFDKTFLSFYEIPEDLSSWHDNVICTFTEKGKRQKCKMFWNDDTKQSVPFTNKHATNLVQQSNVQPDPDIEKMIEGR